METATAPATDTTAPTTWDEVFPTLAPAPATRDELKDQAADQTDLDADRVGQVSFELQKLRQEGLLIGVTIGGTTLFHRRISLEELGIPRTSVRGQTITPGIKYLAPRKWCKKLDSIAQRLRRSLDKYAHDVSGFRPYRYLWYKSYDDFRQEWDKAFADFMEHRQIALDNHPAWKAAFVEQCAQRAHESWQAMMNGDKVLVVTLKDERTKSFETEEAFVEWIVARSAYAYPEKETVARLLRAFYYTAILATGADIATEQARLEEADAQAAEAQARATAARTQAVRDEQEQRVARNEAELKMQAIKLAEYDHAMQELELVVSPVREIMDNLRAQVYRDAQDIAASIRRNGFLNPQVGKRIENLIKLFQIRNAAGDTDIDALLQTVLEWTRSTPKQTGKAGKVEALNQDALGSLEGALQDVVNATHEAAQAVALRAERGADLAMLEI
jgi:hypothetical protein